MKVQIKKVVEVEAKTLKFRAGVRYWEDATVDDVEDTEGSLIPCRINDDWCVTIDIDSGVITNWKDGVTADIHYKVCDDGEYYILDENDSEILQKDGYVPDCLAIGSNGYGDYIIMKVDDNGLINDWKFDISDFIEEEE